MPETVNAEPVEFFPTERDEKLEIKITRKSIVVQSICCGCADNMTDEVAIQLRDALNLRYSTYEGSAE